MNLICLSLFLLVAGLNSQGQPCTPSHLAEVDNLMVSHIFYLVSNAEDGDWNVKKCSFLFEKQVAHYFFTVEVEKKKECTFNLILRYEKQQYIVTNEGSISGQARKCVPIVEQIPVKVQKEDDGVEELKRLPDLSHQPYGFDLAMRERDIHGAYRELTREAPIQLEEESKNAGIHANEFELALHDPEFLKAFNELAQHSESDVQKELKRLPDLVHQPYEFDLALLNPKVREAFNELIEQAPVEQEEERKNFGPYATEFDHALQDPKFREAFNELVKHSESGVQEELKRLPDLVHQPYEFDLALKKPKVRKAYNELIGQALIQQKKESKNSGLRANEFDLALLDTPFREAFDDLISLQKLESQEGEELSSEQGMLSNKIGKVPVETGKKPMAGGWNQCSEEQANKYIGDVLTYVGKSSSLFSAKDTIKCTKQVVAGLNVSVEFGHDNDRTCHAFIFYPLGPDAKPQFDVKKMLCIEAKERPLLGAPSSEEQCSRFTKQKTLDAFKAHAPTEELKHAYIENVMSCEEQFAEGTKVHLLLSFNDNPCDFFLHFSPTGTETINGDINCPTT